MGQLLGALSFASYTYETFHLLMPLFICRKWEGIAQPKEGQTLKWVFPKDMRDYPMPSCRPPADPHPARLGVSVKTS